MIVCSILRIVASHTHSIVIGSDLEELSEERIEDADVECNCKNKGDDVDTCEDKQEIYLTDFSIENLFFRVKPNIRFI